MSQPRVGFQSRIGFIMAAAGSAVGLGNIWSFPTQTAQNGGAAFVLMYLLLAFVLAYPALMAELTIGRAANTNPVSAFTKLTSNKGSQAYGRLVGFLCIVCGSLILSFYALVAGWMVTYTAEPITTGLGLTEASSWLTGSSTMRNLTFTWLFMFLTVWVISKGVVEGIERWSTRLMPMLVVLLVVLIAYVLTLDGAEKGLQMYLVPDFSQIWNPQLMVSAMGQAFFSLSLGAGTMLIYGSYVKKEEHLPKLGAQITLIDTGIAFTAGLLILPAIFVAEHNGITIFDASGKLIAEDTLVFTVLPALFNSMGNVGGFVAFGFFALMTIAALTSSISMLESPVAYVTEEFGLSRKKATWLVGAIITVVSTLIVLNFESLFIFVIVLTTKYGQPLLGLMTCVFAGWLWHRNAILKELQHHSQAIEAGWFWKIWPWYVKFVCPVAIAIVFLNSIL